MLFVLDLEVEGDFPLPAFFFGEGVPGGTGNVFPSNMDGIPIFIQ